MSAFIIGCIVAGFMWFMIVTVVLFIATSILGVVLSLFRY